MLRLICGRAGAGKSALIRNEIKVKALSGETGLVLLVPEQYSHDAERSLCEAVGDSLSLHGEVLSFTRLCNRVSGWFGGASDMIIDAGGRILTMYRAFSISRFHMKAFGGNIRKTEFLESLLRTYDEFKAANISPQMISAYAIASEGTLADKLSDLAILFDTYDSIFVEGEIDSSDRLTKAAEKISDSDSVPISHIYIDGFVDFTAQEMTVIRELIKKRVDITVCMTCESPYSDDLLFLPSAKAALQLIREAENYGTEVKTEIIAKENSASELSFLEENLFSEVSEKMCSENEAVHLYFSDTLSTECELAAYNVRQLITQGVRCREIAVVSCQWNEQGSLLENFFEKYDIPVYLNRKADILEKAPVAVIDSALRILTSGWEYDDVFAYLKTRLTGISQEEIDVLENYVLMWDIKGNMWIREEPWSMSTSGNSDTSDTELLTRIDVCRRKISAPLHKLSNAILKADTAGEQIRALYSFTEDIGLCDTLERLSAEFDSRGDVQLGDEYCQLWNIICKAMEQFNTVLKSEQMNLPEFSQLWRLLISQYDVSSIPVALDRVTIGDVSRVRKNGLRYLLILGANDGCFPAVSDNSGILSPSERDILRTIGAELSESSEEKSFRELFDVYTSITLPGDGLFISYCGETNQGTASYIFKRISNILSKDTKRIPLETCRKCAPLPCFDLAVAGNEAAKTVFENSEETSKKLAAIKASIKTARGALSTDMAKRLYGKRIRLSASKADQYASCRFSYFLKYGLKAKPRAKASFDAPAYGTFIHFVLENVCREAAELGGFNSVSDDKCRELCHKYVNEYAEKKLNGLKDRTSRFRYLFGRLRETACNIVIDLAAELRCSDFAPMEFELSFKNDGDMEPVQIEGGDVSISVDGYVDRLDGYVKDGKLYVRVVDYKTYSKAFSLSDVYYGMGMQMLIYLFAISEEGRDKFDSEIVPAGVMYAPARDIIVNMPRNSDEEKIDSKRKEELRRSGLCLWDEEILEAMEHGDNKMYIPVKLKGRGASTDSLATLENLGALSRHIKKTLTEMGREISNGSISAEPFYKSQKDNACLYCDYRTACLFSEENGDRKTYISKLKTADVWNLIEKEENS